MTTVRMTAVSRAVRMAMRVPTVPGMTPVTMMVMVMVPVTTFMVMLMSRVIVTVLALLHFIFQEVAQQCASDCSQ